MGHAPSEGECDRCEYTVNSYAYSQKYGSWRKALEAAGLRPKTDDEEMIASLKRLTEELGHFPSEGECDLCKYTPHFRTYLRKFGSWSKIREMIM